jgi:glutamyl endopeptidase
MTGLRMTSGRTLGVLVTLMIFVLTSLPGCGSGPENVLTPTVNEHEGAPSIENAAPDTQAPPAVGEQEKGSGSPGVGAEVARGHQDLDLPVSDTGEGPPVETKPSIRKLSSFEGSGGEIAGGPVPLSPAELSALRALPVRTAGLGQETIIGADNRAPVTSTTYPYRAVALITMDGSRCSGWMIGPNTVATAGHCVHTGGSGGVWSRNVRVYPGYTGTSAPYGSYAARKLYSVNGWTSSRNEEYDYGAVKLSSSVGSTTGWFGFWWQSASLTGLSTRIAGYPGDKPLTQWRSDDNVDATTTRQVFYQNDTVGGMSGGPVYRYGSSGSVCPGYCGMAVHAYGIHGTGYHAKYNHGTRITQSVFNNLLSWRNAL